MGDVIGDGKASPALVTRGLANRRGEEGPCVLLAGDWCRLAEAARLGRTRLFLLRSLDRVDATRLRLSSGPGDCPRL